MLKKGVYNVNETNEESNTITGNAIFKSQTIKTLKDYIFLVMGVLILSGLVIYYFFFINDSGLENTSSDYSTTNNNTSNLSESFTNNCNDQTILEINSDEKHLSNLIDHAQNHAQNLNFEQAAKEYALIYSFFNTTSFNSTFKLKAVKTIGDLHKRISVKKKVELANDTVLKGDLELLRKIVNDLEETKNSFISDEKHPLKNYVKDYYDYYSSILSKIDRKDVKQK